MENGDDGDHGRGDEAAYDDGSLELPSRSRLQAQRLNRLQDEEAELLRSATATAPAGGYADDYDDGYDDYNDGAEDGLPSVSRDPSLRRDCRVLSTAWGRLSSPARALLLLAGATLSVFAMYRAGETEGVREGETALGALGGASDLGNVGDAGGGAGPGGGRGRTSEPVGGASLDPYGGKSGGKSGGGGYYTPPTAHVEPADDTNPLDVPVPPLFSSKAEEIRVGHLDHFNMGTLLKVCKGKQSLFASFGAWHPSVDFSVDNVYLPSTHCWKRSSLAIRSWLNAFDV